MSEELIALIDSRRMGTLSYERDRLMFTYAEEWQSDPGAFPLSLSMPLHSRDHSDEVARCFVFGLLPDDGEVLRRWGQRFHVSPRNPFRLLEHVGEECAGAVQFVRPERAENWLAGKAPAGVDWLDEKDLADRIRALVKDRSRARRFGDEGHFSLAGAQPKTGLIRDETSGRWGVPKGATPTTHILKPDRGDFDGYDQNEHFCLRLAERIGLAAAKSWTESIGGIPVIIVERFDRVSRGDRIVRVHQEDMCQALARPPDSKYQSEGGPSPAEIFGLIRDHSAKPQEDVLRFLDALIFNYLIGGTDAHAKNYGFLLAGGGQVRLTRLYDLSSCLPYPRDIPFQKAKLAMKIGGRYRLSEIGGHEWDKAATEWKLDRDEVKDRIARQARTLPPAAKELGSEIGKTGASGAGGSGIVGRLVDSISARAEKCRGVIAGQGS